MVAQAAAALRALPHVAARRSSCPRAGGAGDVMRWLATGQLGGAAKQKWLPPAQRGHRNSGLN